MSRLKRIGKDLLNCLKYSSIMSIILGIAGGLVGLVTSKMNIIGTLEMIKAVLFIVGSIGLFIGALTILKHRESQKEEQTEEWKEKFDIFSYRVVIIIMSIIVILYGCIVDSILFKMI